MQEEVEEADAMHEQDDLQGGADEHEATPQQLRAQYEEHAKAVRELERRVGKGSQCDAALRTLRAARDAAEKAWREAKSPAPLATRMGRAEAKLEKAAAALERARLAVEEFDAWTDARRAELVQKSEEAERWYRWREHQLDGLHEEAGGMAQGRRGDAAGTAGSRTAVSGRILDDLLPQVQDILEHVQGNPEIVERLSLLAAGLASAGHELGSSGAGTAEQFDIGGDDGDCMGCADERGGTVATSGDTANDHGRSKGGAAAGWKPEGPGRWARAKPGTQGGGDTGSGSDGRRAGAGTPISEGSGRNKRGADEPPTAAAHATGADGITTASSAAALGEGDGGAGGADDTSDGARAGKHRRQQTEAEAREEDDKRRAAELRQQEQIAIAAQCASHDAGAGGFGSDVALSMAAQRFVADVQKATRRAQEAGVEPKADDGRELLQLTPSELRQWAEDKLGAEFRW